MILRFIARQKLIWLVTIQKTVILLSTFPVISKDGYSTDIKKTEKNQSRVILEMARAVRIRSTVENFLLLTQSMMFTSATNAIPNFSAINGINSMLKMRVNMNYRKSHIINGMLFFLLYYCKYVKAVSILDQPASWKSIAHSLLRTSINNVNKTTIFTN